MGGWSVALRAALVTAPFVVMTWQALAQSGSRGDGHAEHHDQYRHWMRPDGKGSCCNAQTPDDPNGDCRPTVGYVGDDGRWRARVAPGRFLPVPPDRLLSRQSDGRCHICERGGYVFCFAPCDPKS
ncbi:MAG: hypothetical protein ACOY4R_27665 [Pseudomonadota bacterium]